MASQSIRPKLEMQIHVDPIDYKPQKSLSIKIGYRIVFVS